MTKQSAGAKNKPSEPQQKKKCFVMMPISDCEPYPEGHFKRVYEHLIKPAIIESNFEPLRADDVAATNYIILDIIHEIITSDLVLCDLSGRNPNVMYELGIRHAFGKPTILIKDDLTLRVFDIQGLRSTEYDSSLRIDSAKIDILAIKEAIKDTLNRSDNGRDINSIVQILQIQAATLPEPRNVSEDTQVILSAIKDLANRNANNEKNISRYLMGSASKYKADNHRLELIKKLGIKNLKLRDFDLDLVVEGEPIFLDFELIGAYSGHDNTGVYMKTESGAILKIEFTDYDYERLMIGLK